MSASDSDRCSYPRCKRLVSLTYLLKPLCSKHWAKLIEAQERADTKWANDFKRKIGLR